MEFKQGQILLVKHKIDPIGWLIRKYLHFSFDHTVFVLNSKQGISMGASGVTYDKIEKFRNTRWYDYIVLEFDIKDLNKKCKLFKQQAQRPNIFNWFILFYDMFVLMLNRISKRKVFPRIRPVCSEFVYKNIFGSCWEGITPKDLYEVCQVISYPRS